MWINLAALSSVTDAVYRQYLPRLAWLLVKLPQSASCLLLPLVCEISIMHIGNLQPAEYVLLWPLIALLIAIDGRSLFSATLQNCYLSVYSGFITHPRWFLNCAGAFYIWTCAVSRKKLLHKCSFQTSFNIRNDNVIYKSFIMSW